MPLGPSSAFKEWRVLQSQADSTPATDEIDTLIRAGAARWLLDRAADYLRAARRANGGPPVLPPGTSRLLELLAELDVGGQVVSRSGHPEANLSNVLGMASPEVAAVAAGCSARTARRRAAVGAVRSYQAGPRCVLIDVEGLVRDQRRRKAVG